MPSFETPKRYPFRPGDPQDPEKDLRVRPGNEKKFRAQSNPEAKPGDTVVDEHDFPDLFREK